MDDKLLPAGFERVACTYCGSTDATPYAELQDWLCGLPGRFYLVRCVQCGTLRQNPRPVAEAASQYYPDEYQPFSDATHSPSYLKSAVQAWSLEYGLRRRVRLVARFEPDGRLLDVGCATGLFLDAARRLGRWQVLGIEPSHGAAGLARSQLGLDVFEGTFDGAELDDASFDVVTLWDVLEHLHDPVAALHNVSRILRPGGVTVIRVPHLESIDARLFGRYWAGLDAPRHLSIFPRHVLFELLHQAELDVIDWQCWGGHHIFALSMQFWRRSRLREPAQAEGCRRFLLSPPVRLAAFPWFFFTDRILRRGAALTIVARRQT
jgi:2-polyprenyl-3-methyl-5-hydroxy-6-metoxy-1,4-benzoquinol methylase